MLFDLQITECEGWAVIAPIGEVDLATAPRIRQEGVRVVAGGARQVVVDLGGVDFLDSLGAGVLVALRKRVAAVGGTLRLARPEPQVARVLRLAGVDRAIEVLPTLDEALRLPLGLPDGPPVGGQHG